MIVNPILNLQDPTDVPAGKTDILTRILWQRGIRDDHEVQQFLSPKLDDLLDPFLLKGMKEAVELVRLALTRGDSICIYGDYDVDGMVSTSLLTRFFTDFGYEVQHYIPSRHEEGYGLNAQAIQQLAESGIDLLLTVDCGITSVEEVRLARSLGMQVIVTDHHQCPPVLPEANVIVNPHQPGCSYPNKNLCGAGVAFKWIEAFSKAQNQVMNYQRYLPFAALATVADVVKLIGENRVIVKLGIPLMETGGISGFQALLEECQIASGELNSGHLGFQIAPRLNAVGRLENAELAIRLLTTDDLGEAAAAAGVLSGLNEERKRLEKEILEEAIAQVEKQAQSGLPKFLVVDGQGWNEGVIGIVASRLVERYYRPTIVFARGDDGIAKGSARSISGLNVFRALQEQAELLLRFGGHAQAAGLSLPTSSIEDLRERLNAYAKKQLTELDFRPEIVLDFQIEPNDVNDHLVNTLDKMAPFGFGNPRPVAYLPKVELLNLRAIGKAKEHLSGQIISGSSEALAFVGFHQADYVKKLQAGESVDMAATIGVNRFRGRETLQLQTKTLISAEQEMIRHFEKAQEAIVQYILQFHNSMKYDKIMGLMTMISEVPAIEGNRCLVGMDSFENWLQMKETVSLRGREGRLGHAFRFGKPDDRDKGLIFTYLPNERCFEQEWDQSVWMLRDSNEDVFGQLDWMPGIDTLRLIYRWLLDAMGPAGILKRDLYRMMRVESPYELEACLFALWIFMDVGFLEQSECRISRSRNRLKIDLSNHPLIQKTRQIMKEI
jgi:single-stranded-DNA-specific exonuclease